MKKAITFTVLTAMLLCMCAPMPVSANHEMVYPYQSVTIGNHGYIDKNGSLWLWGENYRGQAGVDPKITEWVDSPIKVMDDVAAFDRETLATIVLKKDGSVWTFGFDYRHGYQKVRGNTDWFYGAEPVKVMDGCTAVSNGGGYGAQFGMLKADGTLWAFGYNLWNNLGIEDDDVTDGSVVDKSIITEPQLVTDGVSSFVMGHYNGFALKNDGSLWYWGNDEWSPYHASGGSHGILRHILDGFRQISVDNGWAAGVMDDGTAWLWGGNFTVHGDLKLSQRIKIGTDVKMVAGTYVGTGTVKVGGVDTGNKPHYCYVLKNDGSLWGKDGTEKSLDGVACVYCSNGYYGETLILKNDGTLIERTYASDGSDVDKVIASDAAVPGAFETSGGQPSVGIETSDLTAGGFKDVYADSWFADPVIWAVEKGITSGTSQTTFSPYDTCSRAQIITFLWRWKGCPSNSGIKYFSDLDGGEYYYDAAQWAYESGIVTGSAFGGAADCTRAAAVEYIWKAFGAAFYSPSTLFDDVPPDASYNQAVSWAFDMNITRGTGFMEFSPDKICNRAEIMTFLYRAEIGSA